MVQYTMFKVLLQSGIGCKFEHGNPQAILRKAGSGFGRYRLLSGDAIVCRQEKEVL
jgi:hypothetical protein